MRLRLLLAVGLLVWLSGCAATVTVAFGDGARAAVAADRATCEPRGVREEKREERVGKLGPDDVTTTTVTEPLPAHESKGASVSEAGGNVLLMAGKWLLCGLSFGSVCLP